MHALTTSFIFWAVVAVGLFWSLGAYNRLVRARADMLHALQALAQQWQGNAQTVRQQLAALSHSPETDSVWASLGDEASSWRPLALATKQFQVCLAALLTKPHHIPDIDDMASVRAAHEVMLGAWQRLLGAHDDLAGAAVPQSFELLWQHHSLLAQEKLRHYNAQVQSYNHAVRQFPAIVLSWLFGFKLAQTL